MTLTNLLLVTASFSLWYRLVSLLYRGIPCRPVAICPPSPLLLFFSLYCTVDGIHLPLLRKLVLLWAHWSVEYSCLFRRWQVALCPLSNLLALHKPQLPKASRVAGDIYIYTSKAQPFCCSSCPLPPSFFPLPLVGNPYVQPYTVWSFCVFDWNLDPPITERWSWEVTFKINSTKCSLYFCIVAAI